ncbi:ArnT family glycosyltransferase [Candidatus Binatus sp.]|uniref:ArnT family glycosyltransferase n=1 Tax=Candidatus Binatus sp. TaxID=2811406 RepID=UPI003CC5547B
MPRRKRARSRYQTGSSRSKSRPPADSAPSSVTISSGRNAAEAAVFRFEGIDVAILALILGFALLLIASTGFANGQELWPIPDAVEYAAVAVNLDRGLGPVLHFAGNSYPPRYTVGYPMMLAAAYPILGHRPERLYAVTVLTALVAIAGLYLLTLWMFDRPSATLAALLLATSPHFLGLSTMVMSDVPALAVVIIAVLTFLYALEKESLLASALCGLLVGLGVTIRVSNGAILIGMIAAALIVRPRRFQLAQALTFAVGFLALPCLQAWLNLHYLGSIFSNGYAFWLPAFYNSAVFKTFKLSYLVAPADPIYRHGNFVAYALAMLGIDGIFGQLHLGTESRTLVHARYSLFPFPVVVFAALGVFQAMRNKRNASTMRALYLGLSFLAVLLIIYLPYFHVEPRFMLPALFIVYAAAGWGLVCANRSLDWRWTGVAVIALDVVLAGAIIVETFSRLTTPAPAQSELVAEVHAIRPQLNNAVLVSDISLQWLELIAGGEQTEFVGLDSELYGRAVNEKHLSWLYQKKSRGWSGNVPPTLLLPGGGLDADEAKTLADDDKRGRPVYLLVAIPTNSQWLGVLKREFSEIDRYFSYEAIGRHPEVALYRLKPH